MIRGWRTEIGRRKLGRGLAGSLLALLVGIAPAYAQSPPLGLTIGNAAISNSYTFVSPGGVAFGAGTLSLTGVATQCLQTNASGVVSGAGGQCGNANTGSANTWTALQTFGANQLAFAGVTGSTQCLQASSSGIVGGTGGPCGGGSGAVNSVSNSDGTLTITPTAGVVVASLNSRSTQYMDRSANISCRHRGESRRVDRSQYGNIGSRRQRMGCLDRRREGTGLQYHPCQ